MLRCLLMPAACVLCCAASFAQDADHFSPGVIIPAVVCSGNPQQRYALYLPTTYSPTKRWPAIYVFDPGGRGQVAVETIRAAAEKYGYIVAGSNNSRNGAEPVSREAAKALWEDTHRRFSIDERRHYFAGMSGGARMATALAIGCNNCVAGVIANAAGFPSGRIPSNGLKFAYFAALGSADFNFLEFVDLRRDLEASGMQYRIRMFEGQHGWAPPEVWQEALHWMDLQAMRSGLLNRDRGWIQESYGEAMQRASRLLEGRDFLEAFREYSFALRDFSGLTDVTVGEKEFKALTGDRRVRNAQKQELSAADEQRRIISEPWAEIQALADGKLSPEELMTVRSTFTTLLKRTRAFQHSEDPQALIARRALSGLVIQALESGQFAVDRKQYAIALHLFDLAMAGSEAPGWGHYQRARVYALTGDKKNMLAELKQAFAGGFRDPSALSSQEFERFQSDPEYQRIFQEWSSKTSP